MGGFDTSLGGLVSQILEAAEVRSEQVRRKSLPCITCGKILGDSFFYFSCGYRQPECKVCIAIRNLHKREAKALAEGKKYKRAPLKGRHI